MLSDFVKYVKQYWHDRPDKSTPLNADRLNHIENGIGSNSEAINQIANAVVSNIVNDPDKIASMAAVYALQEKLGTGELPSDAPNAISAINTLYSNLAIVSSCISNVYIKKIANEGEYTQVFATSIIDSSHFCGLVIADGGLYSFHNIGNVTALVNRSTYKVACNSVGKVARLSITGMGTWDECVIISNRDFTLTHK